MRFTVHCVGMLVALGVLLAAGCSRAPIETKKIKTKEEASATKEVSLPAGLIVGNAPEDAFEVAELKLIAKEGEEVVVRGQIGGVDNPFVAGRAVLTLGDMSMIACNLRPDDKCPKPWDMCCDSDRLKKSITVQILGSDGKLLKTGLEGKNDLLPLSVIVVKGKVGPRPDEETLVLQAKHIFVEKKGMVR